MEHTLPVAVALCNMNFFCLVAFPSGWMLPIDDIQCSDHQVSPLRFPVVHCAKFLPVGALCKFYVMYLLAQSLVWKLLSFSTWI